MSQSQQSQQSQTESNEPKEGYRAYASALRSIWNLPLPFEQTNEIKRLLDEVRSEAWNLGYTMAHANARGEIVH